MSIRQRRGAAGIVEALLDEVLVAQVLHRSQRDLDTGGGADPDIRGAAATRPCTSIAQQVAKDCCRFLKPPMTKLTLRKPNKLVRGDGLPRR